MKRAAVVFLTILLLFAASGCDAEESTAISDSLSLTLPHGIVAFTAEDAAGNEQLRPVLEAVSDGAENLYIGALPVSDEGGEAFSVVYIIQREKEAAAATGVAKIGTYADTNEFAFGLAQWYKANFPDFYVADVLSGKDGAPVFIVHVETEDGVALLGETYSTDYSDSVIACFLDENGGATEPTQAQYDAFVSMLETVSVA